MHDEQEVQQLIQEGIQRRRAWGLLILGGLFAVMGLQARQDMGAAAGMIAAIAGGIWLSGLNAERRERAERRLRKMNP